MINVLENMIHGVLGRVGRGILDVVFPARCVGCGEEGQYICRRCEGFMGESALICPVCQQASFTGERHTPCVASFSLDGLASVWEYEGVVKSLLHSIQHNGVTHAVGESMERAFMILIRDSERFRQFFAFLLSPETVITYIPMYKNRERHLGFNQAELFAQEIARIVKKESVSMLEKIIDTKLQNDIPKQEHVQNIRDAFAMHPYGKNIERVLLVDDAWVTGATMKECCRVLKESGVKEVWGFTLARLP